MTHTEEARIVAAFGRHYEVELGDEARVSAFPKGKKSVYACGDRVAVEPAESRQARIVRHLPRISLLHRSDVHREKLIAANASQVVFVVATEPSFYTEILTRAMIAAESQAMRCLIVLNKCDLAARVDHARELLSPFASLGYPLLEVSALRDATPLVPWLAGELSVLVGQSGMGKSTLVNALVADAASRTREISTRLDAGKHTTTYARLYSLAGGGGLIDSPGLQAFGLAHLSHAEIEAAFVELRPHLGRCRFRDCRHRHEPDCAIKALLASGELDPARYEHYLRLTEAVRN